MPTPTHVANTPDSRSVLHLHDTFSRSLLPVAAMDGREFRFYCCGPTVYGPAHIGNFRTFVMQDVFRRTVEALGTPTRHIRNLTNVDDKTIRQSISEGQSLNEFCDHWTDKFHKDCEALNVLPPHVEPGAVEHIPEQIALIEKLMEKGHAYQGGDGSVYFRIDSFPAYGALSRLQERSITTSSALADEYERDSAADFALWKAWRKEDGPNFWPSPWGDGRPGWHIECSAMAMKHLGESFDLHGGGIDLVFPHHENEIAQSEAATGKRFARHWFHVAHLLVEGQKMSKSLGNLYTLEDVVARGFTAEDLRYALIAGHYRQPLNFTWDNVSAASKSLARLRRFQEKIGFPGTRKVDVFHPVMQALADDLNTPEALGRLFSITKEISAAMEAGSLDESTRADASAGFACVMAALGFRLEGPAEDTIPAEIQALADQRWQARLQKDWAGSDRLRGELTAAGWVMRDGRDSYTLSPADKP